MKYNGDITGAGNNHCTELL